MVLGSIFNFLSPSPSSELDDQFDPRKLLVKADRRSINRERRRLISSFGFEDTIAGSDVSEAKARIENRRTVLGNRGAKRA